MYPLFVAAMVAEDDQPCPSAGRNYISVEASRKTRPKFMPSLGRGECSYYGEHNAAGTQAAVFSTRFTHCRCRAVGDYESIGFTCGQSKW